MSEPLPDVAPISDDELGGEDIGTDDTEEFEFDGVDPDEGLSPDDELPEGVVEESEHPDLPPMEEPPPMEPDPETEPPEDADEAVGVDPREP